MKAGPNTIEIRGRQYLLAHAGGERTHLVAEVTPAEEDAGIESVSATYDDDFHGRISSAYDVEALLEHRWHDKTLCGRPRWWMESGEAGSTHSYGSETPVYAPDCKRCMERIDDVLPSPEPGDRFEYWVSIAIDRLEDYGEARFEVIPADQAALMRKRMRLECRRRAWKVQTFFTGDVLFVLSQDAMGPDRKEIVRQMSQELMDHMWDENPAPRGRPPWCLLWT